MNNNDDVNYIGNKTSTKLYFLRRKNKFLNFQNHILIYKTIISPHFDYCSTVLHRFSQNVYRIKYDKMPKYLCNKLQHVSSIHTYQIRNRNDFLYKLLGLLNM